MPAVLRSPWPGWLVAASLLARHLTRPAPGTATETPSAAETQAAPPGAAPSPAAADPAPALSPHKPLALLKACRTQLARVSAEARAGREPSAEAAAPEPSTLAVSPATTAHGAAGSGAAEAMPDTPDATPARGVAVLSRLLDVPASEARWLGEYVCAVRDLRRDALEQIEAASEEGGDPAQLEASLGEAREQRKAVLKDLRERLGDVRYDTLRSIGGLGLIGNALDCDAEGGG